MTTGHSFCVGLTGGIGSGKSTVANLFAELGASLVDTDLIAHQLTKAGGKAMPALGKAFGTQIISPDGALDRSCMRQLAFTNPEHRLRLEAILHPMIREEAELQLAAVGGPYAILVVPLLTENPAYQERCNRILVVECREDLQVQRVMARNGMSETEIRRIMSTQAGSAARRQIASEWIDNSGDIGILRLQVKALHDAYLVLATRR